ncbi:DUF3054 domain-containing protein [Micrococcaceae bacterium Sec5.7]
MPNVTKPDTTGSPSLTTVAMAVIADAALIIVFAAIGRDAHHRGDVVSGVLLTAWPFLAGAAAAWLALRLWRAPLAIFPAGVAVWLGTVAVGMLLRAVTGQTVVVPFVIVALLSLGLLLLGYRLVLAGILRFRTSRREG